MNISESPGILVAKLAQSIGFELDRRFRAYDVTISQWKILYLLWQQEGQSQVELQEKLGLEGATVTGLLQRMVRQGLAIRRVDPVDKRVQRVYLTERSRALEQVLMPLLDEINAQIFEGFSVDEQVFFTRLLIRARHNFAEK